MPELPEVETIRIYLSSRLIGKKIKNITIFKPKMFIGNPQEVIGAKIIGVERRGKQLIIKLNNKKYLVIHLKVSGQLLFRSKPAFRRPGIYDLRSKNANYALTGKRSFRAKSRSNRDAVEESFEILPKISPLIPLSGISVGMTNNANLVNSKHTRIIIDFDDGSGLFFNDVRMFGWMKVIDSSKFKIGAGAFGKRIYS